jgi:hypothetical protein
MSTQRRSNVKKAETGNRFELAIDGTASTAYFKSVDGGFMRAGLMDEAIGPDNYRIKHASVVDIEPVSLEFGFSGAGSVLKWIQSSWNKEYSRRNGQITHANFDLEAIFAHEFYDALITETSFPALDGTSRDPAYIKIKIQPERVVTNKVVHGSRISGVASSKQKLWLCSCFRLRIDGLDNVEFTNRIEPFTIKQGVRKFYTGRDHLPQIEPTKIEFPGLSGTIALGYADSLLDWHKTYMHGQADTKHQRTGSLEFLAPDKREVLFRINLFEVGIPYAGLAASSSSSDAIKRVKFELYVGRMEIDGHNLGLDK